MDVTQGTAPLHKNLRAWLAAGSAWLVLGLLLTWISNGFFSLDGWGSMLSVLLLAAGVLWLGWKTLAVEQPPHWLGRLLLIAALIRLAAGVAWFTLLPVYGYGNPAERSGYVMGDAFARERMAWRIARSDASLSVAFQGNRKTDQYGGLLFLSALIYRYLGGAFHRPLLMLLLSAAFSALAVPYAWAFTRLAWGENTARLAAWLLTLYPEAVLLGSSQMREAYIITLVIAGLYGLIRYQYYPGLPSLVMLIMPLLLCLPISPPAAAMLLGVILLLAAALYIDHRAFSTTQKRSLWIILALLVPLMLLGVYMVMRQFAPADMVNPIKMIAWYITKAARYQNYMTQQASGWIQKVFAAYPAGVRMPVLLLYGVMQPFMAAALVAGSRSWVWQAIALWRSLGWTVMLALLVYAPFLALRRKHGRAFNLAICLVIWALALLASFRGGADQWDNPRYRAMFAALQVCLVAWTIIEQKRSRDRVMWRALAAIALVVAWFIPWYVRRYFNVFWPVTDIFKTFGLGLLSSFLFIVWDWTRSASLPPPAAAEAPTRETPRFP